MSAVPISRRRHLPTFFVTLSKSGRLERHEADGARCSSATE
jgi:hypothetical protein